MTGVKFCTLHITQFWRKKQSNLFFVNSQNWMCIHGKRKKRWWNGWNRHLLPNFQALSDVFDCNNLFFLILRIECVYTKNWRNGGGTTCTAENRNQPPNILVFRKRNFSQCNRIDAFNHRHPQIVLGFITASIWSDKIHKNIVIIL